MSHHSDFIHRDQTSNGHFLLSKTQPHEAEPAVQPEIISIKRLKEQFPEFLIRNAFTADAMRKLYSVDQFGAFVLAIDGLHSLLDPNDAVINLVKILNDLCISESGFWGLMDNDALGCFLPWKTAADCENTVKQLQQKLSLTRSETISAGIAVYPTISYKKNVIMSNAGKALAHASFFGSGSCVAFDSVSLNISGDQYYQNGDLEGAIEEYLLALKLDENNANVHNSLGVCYGIKNQLGDALEEFKTAMRLEPSDIMPIYNAGYVHLLKKEFTEALECFLKAERIDSEVFELSIQTGVVYLELNQPTNAKKHFETATRVNPESAAAFRLLGQCYAILDRFADATEAYKTSLKLNPNNSCAQSALGYLYEMQGKNTDIALMLCRQAVNDAPENGQFHHRLGRLYLNRGQLQDALEEFQKAHDAGFDSKEYITKTLKLLS